MFEKPRVVKRSKVSVEGVRSCPARVSQVPTQLDSVRALIYWSALRIAGAQSAADNDRADAHAGLLGPDGRGGKRHEESARDSCLTPAAAGTKDKCA
jgi:hypothetical protein